MEADHVSHSVRLVSFGDGTIRHKKNNSDIKKNNSDIKKNNSLALFHLYPL